MKKEIKVCYECGFPLIWTFLFDGAEYYCLNCGGSTGMLGGGENVELTKRLKVKSEISNALFKSLRKYLLGNGNFTRDNCKKCKESGEVHGRHLADEEVLKNKIAMKYLTRLQKTWRTQNDSLSREGSELMKDVLNKIIWTIPVLVIVSLANITKLHFLKKLANGLIMDKLGIYDLQKEIMSI